MSEDAIFVADAETEEDLTRLVRAALAHDIRLYCGSAGLARALVTCLDLEPVAPAPRFPSPSFHGPVLVVAGSRHHSTARQVEVARQQGMEIIRPEDVLLSDHSHRVHEVRADRNHVGERSSGGLSDGSRAALSEPAAETVDRAGRHLSCGRDVVLTTVGLNDSPLGGQAVAAWMGCLVQALVERGPVGGLVLTGGDIAMAVCAALGSTALCLCGEVEPGIAWGRLLDGERPGLAAVTKAGGFGTDMALVRAVRRLGASADWGNL